MVHGPPSRPNGSPVQGTEAQPRCVFCTEKRTRSRAEKRGLGKNWGHHVVGFSGFAKKRTGVVSGFSK